jgi:hypothetical protein
MAAALKAASTRGPEAVGIFFPIRRSMSLRRGFSSLSQRAMAMPVAPARAVLPIRWT